mmetsp:Transcript_37672/g.83892  ORF Transcript_37672/g.83892 Transcript_37672/m.83892 type:complete len:441 (-) Transcript_37672:2613-3935(-)
MRLKVQLSTLGSGLTVDDSLELYCGNGEQILQWIGYTACARLAYKRGEVYGRYVPQSITNKDGQPLDIDIVVNEIFNDGDELFVEYSNGPMPYRVRWEGRPRTPPFKWGDQGEVVPPHDTWLRELDLKQEGLAALVEADLLKTDPSILERDLDKVKELLMQYAGSMQMIFLYQSSEGASSGDQLGQITLPQFRGVMQAARAITPRFPPEKVDEIFTNVATSEQTLARKVENKSGVSTFDLLDFMIAVVHVAYHRYAAELPTQASYNQLSLKLMTLLRESFSIHTFPELQKKLDKFSPAVTNPAAQLLLKRGRKLVEQTLDTCQLKRVKSSTVKVDLRWLCNHLQRWALLNRDFNLQELAIIAVFAKQTTTDPEHFVLHPQPLEYNYNEFERLLLGMAWHVYVTKKKPEPFEEFLGEMLDSIFKKANVLVEVAKDKADADD